MSSQVSVCKDFFREISVCLVPLIWVGVGRAQNKENYLEVGHITTVSIEMKFLSPNRINKLQILTNALRQSIS